MKNLTREELLNLRSLLIDDIVGKQAVREIIKKTGHSIYDLKLTKLAKKRMQL